MIALVCAQCLHNDFKDFLKTIFVFKRKSLTHIYIFLCGILGKIKIKENSCLHTFQEKEKEGKRNGNSGIQQLHLLVMHYKRLYLDTFISINLCVIYV